MLSDLQRRVASIVADLPEAAGFALAGGAALIARGDVDRPTRDLDFFSTDPAQVDRLLPVLVEALQRAWLVAINEHVAAGFGRISVHDTDEATLVDIAADARLFPAEPSEYGLLLSRLELAVDKVLAIFGRAEPRDFVDLAVLEPRFGLDRLFELAHEKDGGFAESVFAEMLRSFSRLKRDEFDVDD